MTETLATKLRLMTGERYTLRGAVASLALQRPDPAIFFQNLERFPEGDECLPLLGNVDTCKAFFDQLYEDIEATLGDMRAAGAFPDFNPDSDIRCWLAEAAFLYTAEKMREEL